MSRKFTILSEAELRVELKVARLNKGFVKSLATVMVLVEFRIGDGGDAKRRNAALNGELEKVFVFPYDAGSPYRMMEVTSAVGTELTKKIIARSANSWSGEGDAALTKERKALGSLHNVREGLDKLAGGHMVALADFVSKIGRRKGSREGGSGEGLDEDEAEDIGDLEDGAGDDCDEPEISGIAACSMVSPMKDRPPVPPFASLGTAQPSPKTSRKVGVVVGTASRASTAAASASGAGSSGLGGSDGDSGDGSCCEFEAVDGDWGLGMGLCGRYPMPCGYSDKLRSHSREGQWDVKRPHGRNGVWLRMGVLCADPEPPFQTPDLGDCPPLLHRQASAN